MCESKVQKKNLTFQNTALCMPKIENPEKKTRLCRGQNLHRVPNFAKNEPPMKNEPR